MYFRGCDSRFCKIHMCTPASDNVVLTRRLLKFLDFDISIVMPTKLLDRYRLTPGSAFGGSETPLMPSIVSKSNPVSDAVSRMASCLSDRSGKLTTKTFSN